MYPGTRSLEFFFQKKVFHRKIQVFEAQKSIINHFSQKKFNKRGSLLGNEEPDLVGDSPIFEIEYSNLEQRSIF